MNRVEQLTQLWDSLDDEQKDEFHSTHRDELGRELPYWRDGFPSSAIATAILTDWSEECDFDPEAGEALTEAFGAVLAEDE